MRFVFSILFVVSAAFHASVSLAESHVALVCPAPLLPSLRPWIEYRTNQGYAIHPLDEIFDEGMPSPEKIKGRLRILAENVPVSALLLVGSNGASQSRTSTGGIPSPRLDCRIIQHFGKETRLAADDWYADLDDDGLADFPVGRFAVDSPDELDTIVRKTIRYETESRPGNWSRRIQIVAGIGNFSPLIDRAIEATAKYALTETVPESWDLAFLHANWKSPFCPSAYDFQREFADTLSRDCLFWVYLGHGHHRMLEPLVTPLGYAPSLHADEFPELPPRTSLPIALLFCCYGGMPDADSRSLAEEMLLQPFGPVAVIAASRTTMPYGMSVFGVELLQELAQRQNTETGRTTLGSLCVQAKRNMLRPDQAAGKKPEKAVRIRRRPLRDSLESLAGMLDPNPTRLSVQLEEHALLFHLFGDPLLELPLPKTILLTCSERVRPGESLTIEGRFDDVFGQKAKTVCVEWLPATSRIALESPRRTKVGPDEATRMADNLEYRSANDRVMLRTVMPVAGDKFSVQIKIPENAIGDYVVRALALEDDDPTGRPDRSEKVSAEKDAPAFALGAARFSVRKR